MSAPTPRGPRRLVEAVLSFALLTVYAALVWFWFTHRAAP